MDALRGFAENVGLGGVADKALDMAQSSLGAMFKPKLEESVDSTLGFLGPKVGEIAVQKMTEKWSVIKKISSAQETAVKAASEAISSFKDEILDFVDDAIDDPQAAFRKVGILLLRGAHEAAGQAVLAIMNLIGCCPCCCFNRPEMVQQVFDAAQEALKDFVNQQLSSRGAPKMLLDKIKWDFSYNDDVGEPKKRRAQQAPQPQTMGASS